MTEPRGIVVVGAGLAGLRTVENLRGEGYGGPLTLVGAEGEEPYDRPPLSKQVLRGERDVVPLRTGDYAALELDLRLGVSATGLDTIAREVHLSDGAAVPFAQLVIATGAAPRTLPGQERLAGVHVLRTARDSLALKESLASADRLAIVGGGFIGCEVAASARALHVDVTLVEMLHRPLVRVLGEPVAAIVQQMHTDHGVTVRTGVGVEEFRSEEGQVRGLTLADGTALDAGVVLVGLGVTPATEWLAGSGVELDDGVLVDAHGESGVPGIFAVGDVARFVAPDGRQRRIEHWTHAGDMARVVARNMLQHKDNRAPYDAIPYVWSDQYDIKIQAVGYISGDDDITLRTVGPKGRTLAIYQRGGALTGAVGLSAPPQVMKVRTVLAGGGSVQDAVRAVG